MNEYLVELYGWLDTNYAYSGRYTFDDFQNNMQEEDFSLEVTSPDIAEPIKVQRQYVKNLNRILTVKKNDAKIEGTLIEVNKDTIVLSWKSREEKPVGKGKITVEKIETIAYQDIIEAKVKIIF